MSFWRAQSLDTDNKTGDAFGRLRVSAPETIFDSKQTCNAQGLSWDSAEVSGSGTTSDYDVDRASTTLGVVLNTAGKRVRQTRRRMNYQPGKSQLVLITGVLQRSGGGTGITRAMGYFDEKNGIFLKDDEGTIKLVRRSYVTGVAVDEEVPQAAWNVDRFNGTGPSGVVADFSKTQILVIDFEWLGVGRVRVGLNLGGVNWVAHEFDHANVLDSVYMSTPNLPIRFEIGNDGTGAASSIESICASVMSEGGSQDVGRVFWASTNGTHVDLATENTVYAVLGLRLQSDHLGDTVKLLNTQMQIQTASHRVEWTLRLRPTVSAPLVFADIANSCLQRAQGAGETVTGGTVIAGGYVESGGVQAGAAGSKGGTLDNALKLGSAVDGTPDELYLCAMPIGGSSAVDVEAGITWRELT